MIDQEPPAVKAAFNKGLFNLVSTELVGKYIERLKAGEVIQSQIRDVEKEVPIYLTYPTGWRYDPEHREYRRKSLEKIKGLVLLRKEPPRKHPRSPSDRSPSEVLRIES